MPHHGYKIRKLHKNSQKEKGLYKHQKRDNYHHDLLKFDYANGYLPIVLFLDQQVEVTDPDIALVKIIPPFFEVILKPLHPKLSHIIDQGVN